MINTHILAALIAEGKIGVAVVATLATAASLVIFHRKSKTLETRAKRAFRTDLLRSVADMCTTETGRSATSHFTELEGIFDDEWRPQRSIPGIARIDLRLQKESATVVTRMVGVLLLSENSRICVSSRKYQWEQLPSYFRSEFIRKGEPILNWSLYNADTLVQATAPNHAPYTSS